MNIFENWSRFVEDIDPSTIDLSSFRLKLTLNKEVWNKRSKLRPEIREKLIQIAEDFFEELDLPDHVDLKDITFTGSLANFNWSQFSDVDLHLIVDFGDIDENFDLVKKFLDYKRMMWNKIHDIYISDHEVEIYVQDLNEPHISSGVYSVYDNDWVVKPSRKKPEIKWEEVKVKTAYIMDEIEEVSKLYSNGEFQEARDFAEKLKKKIGCMRKCGLEQGGEFSTENISFKALRRNGSIEQLNNYKDNSYDKIMSVRD